MARDRPSGSGGFRTAPGPRSGPLTQVFDDVWWAWGTTRFLPGLLFPRNMWIVREGGELVVIHGVMLPDEEQRKVEALGPVKHLVRLGAFHGMDDARYVKRYAPVVWAPPGVDQPEGVRTDRELRPGAPTPLAGSSLLAFASSRTPETVIHLERHGGILFTCDSVQNWDTTEGCSLLGGVMSRMMGFRGRACIGPGWRKLCEPKDGRGFEPDFRRLLQLDFRHALGGHGGPMLNSARLDLLASVDALYT
ncbi:MAG TPA: hypothetical protein VKB80_14915 [Kofleriaceae bacterium]|nr:hypothetical protein [Kofleriaceae bacterium]